MLRCLGVNSVNAIKRGSNDVGAKHCILQPFLFSAYRFRFNWTSFLCTKISSSRNDVDQSPASLSGTRFYPPYPDGKTSITRISTSSLVLCSPTLSIDQLSVSSDPLPRSHGSHVVE